jgi:hypothetical protein
MAKATTISINNFLKTTIHPRLQDGVFWLVFIKSVSKLIFFAAVLWQYQEKIVVDSGLCG